jgi:hypothetical protein
VSWEDGRVEEWKDLGVALRRYEQCRLARFVHKSREMCFSLFSSF